MREFVKRFINFKKTAEEDAVSTGAKFPLERKQSRGRANLLRDGHHTSIYLKHPFKPLSRIPVSVLGVFCSCPGVYLSALICVAEPQGISWETPVEGTVKGESLIESDLGEQSQEQQEHQVQLKLTIEDFVLHKMLGKGSFGKVSIGTGTPLGAFACCSVWH